MLAQEVAKVYSQGLFQSVSEKGLIDQTFGELTDLQSYLKTDESLLDFLVAPHVLDEHKLAVVRDAFTDRMHLLLVEFLTVLVRKHRVGYLPEIIDEFVRLVEADRGVGRATIITAVPLNDGERGRLTDKLAARSGLTIRLEEKIDPAIIGGMIVILHNEIIDGSLRRGLDLIEEQLGKVRVH